MLRTLLRDSCPRPGRGEGKPPYWRKAPGMSGIDGAATPDPSLQEEGSARQEAEERRGAERYKLRLNKIFKAQLTIGEAASGCYLYVLDISMSPDGRGGMRITTDRTLPSETVLGIRIFLEEPLQVQSRVSWQRELEGGTRVYGLQFVDLSPQQEESVRAFMQKFTPEAHRQNFRLNRVLTVEFYADAQRCSALTLDLSPGGMRLVNDFPLEEKGAVPCRLHLDLDRPPVAVTARVQWQKPMQFDRYMIGLEFMAPDAEATERIQGYLERAMRGDLDRQIVLPEDAFEEF